MSQNNILKFKKNLSEVNTVGKMGLEPTRFTTLDPKSSTSTQFRHFPKYFALAGIDLRITDPKTGALPLGYNANNLPQW